MCVAIFLPCDSEHIEKEKSPNNVNAITVLYSLFSLLIFMPTFISLYHVNAAFVLLSTRSHVFCVCFAPHRTACAAVVSSPLPAQSVTIVNQRLTRNGVVVVASHHIKIPERRCGRQYTITYTRAQIHDEILLRGLHFPFCFLSLANFAIIRFVFFSRPCLSLGLTSIWLRYLLLLLLSHHRRAMIFLLKWENLLCVHFFFLSIFFLCDSFIEFVF